MSASIKIILVAVGFASLAGCARQAPVQDEVIFVEPAPILPEPVYNKYR